MGRPWDYPRWRRVLMQLLMWVILGGTLGLAQFITRERQDMPVELGEPIRLGPFYVRLPEGWKSSPQDDDYGVVAYVNQDQTEVLRIGVEELPLGSNYSKAIQLAAGGHNSAPITFAGLKLTGVLNTIPVPAPAGFVSQRQIIASVVAPPRYLVQVQLVQPDRQVEAEGILFVKAIASGITEAPKAPIGPSIRSTDRRDD